LIYRFHPSVVWSQAFPHRDEILGQIEKVWKIYGLDSRTRFKTEVTKVVRAGPKDKDDDPNRQSRWLINDDPEPFDAVIVTVGACGKPKRVHFPGMPGSHQANGKSYAEALQSSNGSLHESNGGPHEGEKSTFKGIIVHSSELDKLDLEGKTIVVIGSGASGVEAVETAIDKKAKKAIFVARSDKWIIPRNIIIDTFLAAQPFGRQMPLSFLWEDFLKFWQYRHTPDLVPAHTRIFEGTPIVNDEFLVHVREGRCEYVRGDTQRLTEDSVIVNVRDRDSKPGDKGEKRGFKADVVVLATGFEQPTIDFLPDDLFPDDYKRPNLYLQNFSTEDWSILMTNSSYVNGIGTVGHIHIGFYTRILLTLLMDVHARPSKKDMKLWVDVVRFIKQGARGGALGFFTYMELTIWILLFHVLRPDRLRWLFFIMLGWGVPERK
jgi:cation diffusion facilitator CzcD-associated flavoprotein CzcO